MSSFLDALIAYTDHIVEHDDGAVSRLLGIALVDGDEERPPIDAPGAVAVAISVEELGAVGGDMFDGLVGFILPDVFHGVLLSYRDGGASQVHLVLRDGTEIRRTGFGDDTVRYVIGADDTPVGWALRRSIHLPSNAPVDDLPSVEDVRRRALLAVVVEGMVYAVMYDLVEAMLLFLQDKRDELYMETCLSFGLFEDDWDSAHMAARRRTERTGEQEIIELANWTDGPLWARYCSERFGEVEASMAALSRLMANGSITAEQAATAVRIPQLPPRDIDPF